MLASYKYRVCYICMYCPFGLLLISTRVLSKAKQRLLHLRCARRYRVAQLHLVSLDSKNLRDAAGYEVERVVKMSKEGLCEYLNSKGLEPEVIDTVERSRLSGTTFLELSKDLSLMTEFVCQNL